MTLNKLLTIPDNSGTHPVYMKWTASRFVFKFHDRSSEQSLSIVSIISGLQPDLETTGSQQPDWGDQLFARNIYAVPVIWISISW